MPTIILNQTLDDVMDSINQRSLVRGLMFFGHKYHLAIWEVGNCLITAFEVAKGITEIKLVNFKLTEPDDDACQAWNHIATFWETIGWVAKAELAYQTQKDDEYVAEISTLESEWAKAMRDYEENPAQYEATWKMARRREWARMAPNQESLEKEVAYQWSEHQKNLAERNQRQKELSAARAAAANKKAAKVAEEYWITLEKLQPKTVGTNIIAGSGKKIIISLLLVLPIAVVLFVLTLLAYLGILPWIIVVILFCAGVAIAAAPTWVGAWNNVLSVVEKLFMRR